MKRIALVLMAALILAVAPEGQTLLPMPDSNGLSAFQTTTANHALVVGTQLTQSVTVNNLTYTVSVADSTSHAYGIGFYSGSGAGATCSWLCGASGAGSTLFPSTGSKTVSLSPGSCTLPAGRIYTLVTTNAPTSGVASIAVTTMPTTLGPVADISIATGGTLPASFTCPADFPAVTVLSVN